MINSLRAAKFLHVNSFLIQSRSMEHGGQYRQFSIDVNMNSIVLILFSILIVFIRPPRSLQLYTDRFRWHIVSFLQHQQYRLNPILFVFDDTSIFFDRPPLSIQSYIYNFHQTTTMNTIVYRKHSIGLQHLIGHHYRFNNVDSSR